MSLDFSEVHVEFVELCLSYFITTDESLAASGNHLRALCLDVHTRTHGNGVDIFCAVVEGLETGDELVRVAAHDLTETFSLSPCAFRWHLGAQLCLCQRAEVFETLEDDMLTVHVVSVHRSFFGHGATGRTWCTFDVVLDDQFFHCLLELRLLARRERDKWFALRGLERDRRSDRLDNIRVRF